MKRANGEGNIRKRKNGVWEARYTVGIDEQGKVIRRSIYGKSQAEVRKKLSAVTNDLNTGVYIAPDAMTVSEWFDLWIKEYNGNVKESTRSQYAYQGRCHIKPVIGNKKLQKITAPALQKFINERFENGLSPKSCRNLHGVLHKLFNQAVLCGYIKSNPVSAVQLPRVEKKEMHILSGNNLKAFLAECQGKVYSDLFFVDVFTGMRESEIIGLTWDCVDFEKGIITIEKQLKRERKSSGTNEYRFDTLKNGKTRVISPAPAVFDCLKRERTKQAENRLKYGSAYNNEYNLVFTNEIGEHLSPVTIYGCFKRRVDAIGLPDVRFHDLRHSYAVISIENNVDYKTISESMGHFSVAFTLDVYGHVSEKMRKDSADRVQAYIEQIGV